jgi:hypothetical protein
MIVDVTWDGVSLARAAQAHEQDGGWLVELEQPMPVGTALVLSGEAQATVRVARVNEGAGAGMLLKRVDGQPSTADSPRTKAAPVAEAANAVPSPVAEAANAVPSPEPKAAAEPAAEAKPKAEAKAEPEAEERNGNGQANGKKDRRRKARKTIIGH